MAFYMVFYLTVFHWLEVHGAGHLGPLSAGRFHPVLQIRHRAVSGVVRLDPVHFVLSAPESAPCRLLAALPAFVCGHDLCTGLLYRPAHGALPAALPGVWQ